MRARQISAEPEPSLYPPRAAAPLNGFSHGSHDPLIDLVIARHFAGKRPFARLSHGFGPARPGDHPVDYLFLRDQDPHLPAEVFDRLRWGGQVVLVSRNPKIIKAAAKAYQTWRKEQADHGAWEVEKPMGVEQRPLLRFFGWRQGVYFLTARKVMLVPPGKSSDRFTYHVQLSRHAGGGYEVVKEVPAVERVLARLREKFPDADADTLLRRARKFTEKVFPVFLTRETAMLKLLQRDLPEKFRNRVPQVMAAETDEVGFTRTLRMNWLRNARPARGSRAGLPLSQLEFARQAAELLTALHDQAGIMHLDLRLDNVVITELGVGFVDFGSAVRVGEEFPQTSLLSNLFEEMMRTSQIQRMLGKMAESGQVTSEEICNSHQRIDKAVDFFFLAVQINSPLSNPDFRGLVEHDPASREAQELAQLTEKILRPESPEQPQYTSAAEILHGIEEIGRRLGLRP
jgi:hypothetical protein